MPRYKVSIELPAEDQLDILVHLEDDNTITDLIQAALDRGLNYRTSLTGLQACNFIPRRHTTDGFHLSPDDPLKNSLNPEDILVLNYRVPVSSPRQQQLRSHKDTSSGIFKLEAFAFTPDPNCPGPEESTLDYDEAAIKRRLDYATQRNSRKVSPRADYFAREYLEASETAMAIFREPDHSKQEVRKIQEQLHTLDLKMQYNRELYYLPNKPFEELLENLQKLRDMEWYGTYSDYFSINLRIFKDWVYKNQKDNLEYFQKYWTEIQDEIDHETVDQEQNPGTTDAKTTAAVRAACLAIGWDGRNVFWAIEQYAKRNRLFHSDLGGMLDRYEYPSLARRLYQDRKDQKALNPDGTNEVVTHLVMIIDLMIQRLFVFEPGQEDMPWAWRLTKEAIHFGKKVLVDDMVARAEFRDSLKKPTGSKTEKTEKLLEDWALLQRASRGTRSEKERFSGISKSHKQAGIHKLKLFDSVLDLQRQIEKLDARREELDTRREKLDTRIGKLDTRIGKLDTRIGKLDTRRDQLCQELRDFGIEDTDAEDTDAEDTDAEDTDAEDTDAEDTDAEQAGAE